jgi:hypothetical protein
MIKVENLTKRYAGFTAIQDLNFEVEKGEIVGLPWTKRRRQDDDHAHPHRLSAGDIRFGVHRRIRCV